MLQILGGDTLTELLTQWLWEVDSSLDSQPKSPGVRLGLNLLSMTRTVALPGSEERQQGTQEWLSCSVKSQKPAGPRELCLSSSASTFHSLTP